VIIVKSIHSFLLAESEKNIFKDLPLSGSISLKKISISMSTDTNGPWKQPGGGNTCISWQAGGGGGKVPPFKLYL